MPIWTDDLIWCPSQCYAFDKQPDRTFTCLYLRWRWNDPWQAHIITGLETDVPLMVYKGDYGPDWFRVHDLHFTDEQLDDAKATLLCIYKTGMPPS